MHVLRVFGMLFAIARSMPFHIMKTLYTIFSIFKNWNIPVTARNLPTNLAHLTRPKPRQPTNLISRPRFSNRKPTDIFYTCQPTFQFPTCAFILKFYTCHTFYTCAILYPNFIPAWLKKKIIPATAMPFGNGLSTPVSSPLFSCSLYLRLYYKWSTTPKTPNP